MLCFFFFVCFNLFAKKESNIDDKLAPVKSGVWDSISGLFKKNKNFETIENAKLIGEIDESEKKLVTHSLVDRKEAFYCLNGQKIGTCPDGSIEKSISEINTNIGTGKETIVTIYVYGINNAEILDLSKKGLSVNIIGKTKTASISPSFSNKETNIVFENIEITPKKIELSSKEKAESNGLESLDAVSELIDQEFTLSSLTISLKNVKCNDFSIDSQSLTADFKSLNTVDSVNVKSVIALTGDLNDIDVFPPVSAAEKVILLATTSKITLGSESVSISDKCSLKTNNIELLDSEKELIIEVIGTEKHPQLSLVNNKSPKIKFEGEKSQNTITIDRKSCDFLELSVQSESKVKLTGNAKISIDFDDLSKLDATALGANTQVALKSDKESNSFTYNSGEWTIVADGKLVKVRCTITNITLTNENANAAMSIQTNIANPPTVEITGFSTISIEKAETVTANIPLLKGEDCTVIDNGGIFEQTTIEEELIGSEFCIFSSAETECPSPYKSITMQELNNYLSSNFTHTSLSLIVSGSITEKLDLSSVDELEHLTIKGSSKTSNIFIISTMSQEDLIQHISISNIILSSDSLYAGKLEVSDSLITGILNAAALTTDFSSIESVTNIFSENITFTAGNPGERLKNAHFNGVKNLEITSPDVKDIALDNSNITINNNAKISASSFSIISQNDIILNIQNNATLIDSTFKLSGSLTVDGSEVRTPGKLHVLPYANSGKTALENENSNEVDLILKVPAALSLEESIGVKLNYNSAVNLICDDVNKVSHVVGSTITIVQTNELQGIELLKEEFKLYDKSTSATFSKSLEATFRIISLAKENQTIAITAVNEGFYNPYIEFSSFNTVNVTAVNLTDAKIDLVCTNDTLFIGDVLKVNASDASGKPIIPSIPDTPITSTLPEISPDPESQEEPEKSNIGPIVGGVIGGIAAIVIIVVLVVWYVKTPHEASEKSTGDLDILNPIVPPAKKNVRKPKFAKEDTIKTDNTTNFTGEFWI